MEIISGLPAECFHPSFKNGQDGASGRGSHLSQAAGGGKSLSLQLPQASGRLDGLCLPQPGTEEPSQAAVRAAMALAGHLPSGLMVLCLCLHPSVVP